MSSIQLVGIDWSNGIDYTAITARCSGCGAVLDFKYYDQSTNGMEIQVYKNCPVCGVKFKEHIIFE